VPIRNIYSSLRDITDEFSQKVDTKFSEILQAMREEAVTQRNETKARFDISPAFYGGDGARDVRKSAKPENKAL
jgi:hypothetical protein